MNNRKNTMKAIIINQPGGIEVLQLEDVAGPETREGHVKIGICNK